jgi:YggT family protein
LGLLKTILVYALSLYLLLLIGRLILSWIQAFARSWEPRGIVLVLAEAIYTATDPPLKLLRRYLPSVRLGNVALDLSFTVLFIVVLALINIVGLL